MLALTKCFHPRPFRLAAILMLKRDTRMLVVNAIKAYHGHSIVLDSVIGTAWDIKGSQHDLQLLLLVAFSHSLGSPAQIILYLSARSYTMVLPSRLWSAFVATISEPLPQAVQGARWLGACAESNIQIVIFEKVFLFVGWDPLHEVQ
jgi:hypothetical protein